MLRTVMSIAFLSAFLAVTPIAFSAEADAEKCEKSAQCEKGQCEKDQLRGGCMHRRKVREFHSN